MQPHLPTGASFRTPDPSFPPPIASIAPRGARADGGALVPDLSAIPPSPAPAGATARHTRRSTGPIPPSPSLVPEGKIPMCAPTNRRERKQNKLGRKERDGSVRQKGKRWLDLIPAEIRDPFSLDTRNYDFYPHPPRRAWYPAVPTSAMADRRNGANVKGYSVWSFMDLYELFGGYNTWHYGLIAVDFSSAERRRQPKRSASWYSDFLKNNAVIRVEDGSSVSVAAHAQL
uniref:Uncharacterized protein n=2 Tax=Oryza TaxID=4527 RepID=A0A0D3G6Q6_9ORYZ